jgi:hypothetical protein
MKWSSEHQPKTTGHRFKPGNKFACRQYRSPLDADQRLRKKHIRALKAEYGPDLVQEQKDHIENIANLRLDIAKTTDPETKGELIRQMRREYARL